MCISAICCLYNQVQDLNHMKLCTLNLHMLFSFTLYISVFVYWFYWVTKRIKGSYAYGTNQSLANYETWLVES